MQLRSTYAGVTTSGESVAISIFSFLSASTNIDGTKVVLTYNEILSATTASVSTFAVTTAGAANSVTAVTIVGSTVELTLTATIQNDQAVTVAYTDPSGVDDANAIQDSNGNDAASLAATSVNNISTVAGTAPVFQSAATNASGTKVILTYDEALSTTTAATSTFSVTSGGSANAVTAVTVSGSTIELTLTSIINDTQSVSFTYTDPSGADDTNAIQDFAGNDAVSVASTAVTNNSTVDGTPPSFQSASTNTLGTLVVLTYDEALSTTTASPSAFAVTTGGVNNAVTAVAVFGSTVELTLTTIVQNDQSVTVAYTDPSGSDDSNSIQDTTGNDAATLGSTAVTNISTVAGTAPVFQSAATNNSGTKVILTYNESLSATTAGTSTFAVTVDSSANAVTAVTNVGSTVELTLTSAITNGQSITVAYTDPSGSDDVNAIQDTAGNDAASLGSTSVTNNVPAETTPPVFQSAATTTDGTKVILTYDETLSTTTAGTSTFAVTSGGSANAVTAVAVSGSTVELTLTNTIRSTQSVTVAYTDPSGSDDVNAIQDTAGNDAATLASTSVTNNSTVDGTAPTFSSAATTTDGTKVILTYDETLSTTTAGTSTFAVTSGGSANAVTAVAVSGSTVELTLTNTIRSTQSVTVAYTDPSGSDDVNAIQDTAGNDAATLASTSVTNNSTVESIAPSPVSASVPTSGSSVNILFDEALSASNTIPISALTVTVDGTDNPVTAATVFGGTGLTIIVTVSNTIDSGETVTVSYTDPTAGDDAAAIQDLVGNDVASFTNLAVTNNSTQVANTCTWSMRYHMYGEHMGTFEVYVEQSGSFTRILQKVGQQHTDLPDEYDLLTYDLMPSFAGQDVRIYCIHKHEANVSFRGDVAIDALTLTTNGTASDFSGQSNATKWVEGRMHGTLTAAQTNSNWYNLNNTLDNRRWNIESGGPTISTSTGPDKAYDNDIDTNYIYWEASVTGQTLSTDQYYPLRTTNVIAVPS